jgi:tetratricopeptide (TPR) repeat protein
MIVRPRMPALVFALVALLAIPAPATESLTDTEIQDLYSQAKQSFRRGMDVSETDPEQARDLFGRAAMRFERIVREGGIQNGRLFYNIGNAYFRTGDIGRAILNYCRAEQYIPTDEKLQQNLAYARQRRKDAIEPPQTAQVLETLLFWHYDFSARTRSIVFAACFLVFWISAALRLARSSLAPRWLLAFAAAGAVLFFGSLAWETWRAGQVRPGVILAREVVARKGDGLTYQPSFADPLHAGTEFVLVQNRGNWLEIKLANQRRCWVPADAVGLVR